MKSLYCPKCQNYLMGGSGCMNDCSCGWVQPEDVQPYSEAFWVDYGVMTFSDWFENHKTLGWDDDCEFPPTPRISLDGVDLLEVRSELERLGFGCGNDFSKHFECKYAEIWYGDFYNVFLSGHDDCRYGIFDFTLEDLRSIEV